MLDLNKLEDFYSYIRNYTPKNWVINIDTSEINTRRGSFYFLDDDFTKELRDLNIIFNYKKDNSFGYGNKIESFDLYLEKINFLLWYNNKLNNEGFNSDKYDKILVLNNKIKKIWFNNIYSINLNGKYKIRNIDYFVYFIYYLNESDKIKILG